MIIVNRTLMSIDDTMHKIIIGNSANMDTIDSESVHLVVTSPPYPMVQMWDEIWDAMSEEKILGIMNDKPYLAFERMHNVLDTVWYEINRVLSPGGIVCINIGDATRTIDSKFRLFSNHSRIISSFIGLGFDLLPSILWRKPSNKPNKFMGSGMLPVGAYISHEHEYILVFRKGEKRKFSENDKSLRRKSAFFWEERNKWFSDLWTITGDSQIIKEPKSRKRTASYPLELVYRLINMYSIYGDTILDPFLGTGTTILAGILTGRNTIGYDIDENIVSLLDERIGYAVDMSETIYTIRLQEHESFIDNRIESGKKIKHINENYDVLVISKQETEILLPKIKSINKHDRVYNVKYM